MASAQRSDSREEPLNDSWVELHFQQQQQAVGSTHPSSGASTPRPYPGTAIHSSAMEKLLLEAQRDFSRGSSRVASATSTAASSRGSPKSPHSPNNEPSTLGLFSEISTIQERPVSATSSQESNSDWIWEWSSRPEAVPPSEFGSKFKHPRRHKLSVRNTKVMTSGIFALENLPILILTHACTFFLGAAAMLVYLKKFCKWTAMVMPSVD